MRHIIFLFIISLFTISCGQNDTKEKELELKEREIALKEKEFALKGKDTVVSMTDSKVLSPQKKQINADSTIAINSNDFLGKWTKWNSANNCNDVIELKKTNNVVFNGDFYPECFEDAGFVQKGKLEGDKIIFSKDEGFQGCILKLSNGKLIETNLSGKGKITYNKVK